jgi:hypothetical protein
MTQIKFSILVMTILFFAACDKKTTTSPTNTINFYNTYIGKDSTEIRNSTTGDLIGTPTINNKSITVSNSNLTTYNSIISSIIGENDIKANFSNGTIALTLPAVGTGTLISNFVGTYTATTIRYSLQKFSGGTGYPTIMVYGSYTKQ